MTTNFTYTFPAQSITLFVIPQRTPASPHQDAADIVNNNEFPFLLMGEAGFTYVVDSSANFSHWTPIQTNLLSTNVTEVIVPRTNQTQFYRARWLP